MSSPAASPTLPSTSPPLLGRALEERLERGELVVFERCPFALPAGDDLSFLLAQTVEGAKSISYYPYEDRTQGHRVVNPEDEARLRRLLRKFHQAATAWLQGALPRYHAAARFGPLRFRTEEEEGRDCDPRYSGSVLHVDMSSDAPAHGESFLRIFVNVNPSRSREWITSEALPALLDHWGDRVRVAGERRPGLADRLKMRFGASLGLSSPRLHYFGKTDDFLQNRAPRQHWVFPPGSMWMVFSDIVSHAVVRGQYAIDQTYLIPAHAFRHRACSTQAIIDRFWRQGSHGAPA